MTPFLATVLLFLLAPGEAVAAEGWRRPLPDGAVSKAFAYDRAAPYLGGARRGIDVAGSAGARVGAVCRGVVTWAGGVPRWGRGVTLRCPDGLVATELGLASLAVGRGARVMPGTPLGRLRADGVLRVGARRDGDRFGWIDPAPLFAEDDPAPPLVAPPATARRTPVAPPVAVAPRRVAAPRPALVARPLAAPKAAGAPSAPVPILIGLALLAVAATGAPVARRRRSRRPTAGIALAQR